MSSIARSSEKRRKNRLSTVIGCVTALSFVGRVCVTLVESYDALDVLRVIEMHKTLSSYRCRINASARNHASQPASIAADIRQTGVLLHHTIEARA